METQEGELNSITFIIRIVHPNASLSYHLRIRVCTRGVSLIPAPRSISCLVQVFAKHIVPLGDIIPAEGPRRGKGAPAKYPEGEGGRGPDPHQIMTAGLKG
jgi:hypothetical protein